MKGLQLTYADRELLLQSFDALRAGWNGEDKQLLSNACNWAKQLVPNYGFEHSLTRDVTALSQYLVSYQADEDIAGIARGGLLYVTTANYQTSDKFGGFGLLDDAFITSYAVHEIRSRLGEQTTYNPPRLTQKEQRQAESLFLELAEQPVLNDQDLIEQSRKVAEGLASLATCGLFRRMQRNIEFLISVVGRSNRSPEQKAYARAALSYLICKEDVIDDRLGIVGYLDDNFTIQMAVELIEPSRDPWLNLLDAAVGAWPFLNILVIDDGSGGRPLSEYMIINSALSCAQLRQGSSRSTALIVPFAGPTHFLLGFIAALGLIQQSGQREVTESSFSTGQKVLIDNYAVAEFAGITEIAGRRMFGLTQYRQQQGHKLRSTHYWPISELRRVLPAALSRTPRGQLTYDLTKTDMVLPALEYLFNASRAAYLATISKKVMVITPVALAEHLAKHMQLFGHPLKDVIPMGHLSEGVIKTWSNRFGEQDPLLVFASDLDAACIYAEENTETIDQVIVDISGRNLNKAASLRELTRLGSPTLVVTPERSASDLYITSDDSISIWEWDSEDFATLLWPQDTSRSKRGPISRYEGRLQFLQSPTLQIEDVSCALAEEVFEAIRYLKSLSRQHEEDPVTELDELIAIAFSSMFRLLRSATPLTPATPSFWEIEQGIKKIDELQRRSRYLSEAERSAAKKAEGVLSQFFSMLQEKNPKAVIVRELLRSRPELTIICPDSRLLLDLEHAYAGSGNRVLSDYDDADESDIGGAILPGWFGKDRMAKMLIPPVTDPLHLVLYDLEHRWYKLFIHERQKNRQQRVSRHTRSKIFVTLHEWSDHRVKRQPLPEVNDYSLREVEAAQEHIRAASRQRAYREAKSQGTEVEVSARLVMFEGDAYAFLRDTFNVNVVTHLLDAAAEDSNDGDVGVKRKTVKDLKAGDALLFHRRSDRDVIRLVADKELSRDMRKTASLWQKALTEYARRENIGYKDVWKHLKEEGCPIHHQTVRSWMDDEDMIAPRQYERDVRFIAKVTKDSHLNADIEAVLNAINTVFGAHQRASNKMAYQVLHRAVEILREEQRQSKLIEIESDVVLVRVTDVDDHDTKVRLSIANRLQEPDQWQG